MAKKKKQQEPEGVQTIAENRRARRDYEIVETLEGGLVLKGTEVKSLRDKNVSFADAYALVKNHEVFLIGLTIDAYRHGNIHNHEPDRTRKVLLKTDEIERLEKQMQRQAVQLIPLKLYFKNGWAKVLLGIGKGKTHRDKRDDIKKREADRDIRRALKRG
jgi:SsrA-binding protein